ncbi:hypothetical protein BJ875DRAFT_540138 [Amylocarpus encephaloides]|uniref:Uncharacterized protein n=1 Tax=Amylocarpus encephaloides TaxID=45428 RepID=A0A9P7YQP7_9HELO|nr:hypothetical protein BJ875DRAFT_540138 [Amylocarpus encephaloides]
MDLSDDTIAIDLDTTEEVTAESDEDDNFEKDLEAEVNLAMETGYGGDHPDDDDELEIWDEEGNENEKIPHEEEPINLDARNKTIAHDSPQHQIHGSATLDKPYIAMLQEYNSQNDRDEDLKEQLESLSREARGSVTDGQQRGQQLMHLLSEPPQRNRQSISHTDGSRYGHESVVVQLQKERDDLALENTRLREENEALIDRAHNSHWDEPALEVLEDLRYRINGKGGYEEVAAEMKAIFYDFEENYVPKDAHTNQQLGSQSVQPHPDQQMGSITSPYSMAPRQHSNCQNCEDLQKRFDVLHHESSLDSARHKEATQKNLASIQELKDEIVFHTNEITKSEQTRVTQLQQLKGEAATIMRLEDENQELESQYNSKHSRHLKEIERRDSLEEELRTAVDLYKQRPEAPQVSAALLKDKDEKIAKLRSLSELQEISLKKANTKLKNKEAIIASSLANDQLRDQLTSVRQEISEKNRDINLLEAQNMEAITERDVLTVKVTKAADDLDQQKKTIEGLRLQVNNTDKKYDDLTEQFRASLDSEKHLEGELYRVTREFNVAKGHLSDSHTRYSEASRKIKELEEAGSITVIEELKARIEGLEAHNLKAVGIIDDLKTSQGRLESQVLKEKDIIKVLQGRIGTHHKQKRELEDLIVSLGGTVDNYLLGKPAQMQSPGIGSAAPPTTLKLETKKRDHGAQTMDSEPELGSLRKHNRDLQQRVAELMANFSKSTDDVRRLQGANGALEQRIDGLIRQTRESMSRHVHDVELHTSNNSRLRELGLMTQESEEQIHRLINDLGGARITIANLQARNRDLTQRAKRKPSQLPEQAEGSAASVPNIKRPRLSESSIEEEQPKPKKSNITKKAKAVKVKKGPTPRKPRAPMKEATPAPASQAVGTPAASEPEAESSRRRPVRATRNSAPKYDDTHTTSGRLKKSKAEAKAKGPRKESAILDPNYVSPAQDEHEDDGEEADDS